MPGSGQVKVESTAQAVCNHACPFHCAPLHAAYSSSSGGPDLWLPGSTSPSSSRNPALSTQHSHAASSHHMSTRAPRPKRRSHGIVTIGDILDRLGLFSAAKDSGLSKNRACAQIEISKGTVGTYQLRVSEAERYGIDLADFRDFKWRDFRQVFRTTVLQSGLIEEAASKLGQLAAAGRVQKQLSTSGSSSEKKVDRNDALLEEGTRLTVADGEVAARVLPKLKVALEPLRVFPNAARASRDLAASQSRLPLRRSRTEDETDGEYEEEEYEVEHEDEAEGDGAEPEPDAEAEEASSDDAIVPDEEPANEAATEDAASAARRSAISAARLALFAGSTRGRPRDAANTEVQADSDSDEPMQPGASKRDQVAPAAAATNATTSGQRKLSSGEPQVSPGHLHLVGGGESSSKKRKLSKETSVVSPPGASPQLQSMKSVSTPHTSPQMATIIREAVPSSIQTQLILGAFPQQHVSPLFVRGGSAYAPPLLPMLAPPPLQPPLHPPIPGYPPQPPPFASSPYALPQASPAYAAYEYSHMYYQQPPPPQPPASMHIYNLQLQQRHLQQQLASQQAAAASSPYTLYTPFTGPYADGRSILAASVSHPPTLQPPPQPPPSS